MMEQVQFDAQTLAERDVLYPKNEAVPRTTSDVIILGENAHSLEPAIEVEKTIEELVDEGVNIEIDHFGAWLNFKVKNELIDQIFRGDAADGFINITAVSALLKDEVDSEAKKHSSAAYDIELRTMPEASLHKSPLLSGPYNYSRKDMDNLEVRLGVHDAVSKRLDLIVESGDDGLHTLSEILIQRMIGEARDEAITILVKKQAELEAGRKADAEYIATLLDTIGRLQSDNLAKEAQIEERDLQLLDSEAEAFVQLNPPKSKITV